MEAVDAWLSLRFGKSTFRAASPGPMPQPPMTIRELIREIKSALVDLEGGSINLPQVRMLLEETRTLLIRIDPDRVPIATAHSGVANATTVDAGTKDGQKWCTICNTLNRSGVSVGNVDGSGQRFAHRACYELARIRREEIGNELDDQLTRAEVFMLKRVQQVDDTVTELWLKTKSSPGPSVEEETVGMLRAICNSFSVEAREACPPLKKATVWLFEYERQQREVAK